MLGGSSAKLLVMTAPGSGGDVMEFRAANDGKVANFAGPGRVVGGLVRACGELSSKQAIVEHLFDGDNTTKWLDVEGAQPHQQAWVEYRLMPDAPPVVLTRYLLTSGNDHPERDPAEWVLEGLTVEQDDEDDKDQLWTILDWQTTPKFKKRKQTLAFPLTRRVACCSFRIRIIRCQHPSAMVQISCLDLFYNPMDVNHPGGRLTAVCPACNDPPVGLTLRAREQLVRMETWQGSGFTGGKQQGGLTHPVPVTSQFPAWAEWVVSEAQAPVALQGYSFMLNVDGDAQKAPRSWVLEGLPAGGGLGIFDDGDWLELDRQEGVSISVNDMGAPLNYRVETPWACNRFRLRVTAGHTPDAAGVSISRVFFHQHVAEQTAGSSSPGLRAHPSVPHSEWPGTDWQQADETGIDEELLIKGRLYGGWSRGSDELVEHSEFARNAFDGRIETKWLEPVGASTSRPAWLEYRLMPDVPPAVLTFYSIVSANDHMERDPQDWTLQGFVEGLEEEEEEAPVKAMQKAKISQEKSEEKSDVGEGVAASGGEGDAAKTKEEGGENKTEGPGDESEGEVGTGAVKGGRKGKWVVLGEQSAVVFDKRHQEIFFEVRKKKVACQRFRLCVTATRQPACMQLSCLNLYAQPGL